MPFLYGPLSLTPKLPQALSLLPLSPAPPAPPAPLLFAQGCKGLHICCGSAEVLSGHGPVHGPESRQRSKGG